MFFSDFTEAAAAQTAGLHFSIPVLIIAGISAVVFILSILGMLGSFARLDGLFAVSSIAFWVALVAFFGMIAIQVGIWVHIS